MILWNKESKILILYYSVSLLRTKEQNCANAGLFRCLLLRSGTVNSPCEAEKECYAESSSTAAFCIAQLGARF
jgi:hypothetical protein